MQVHPVQAEKIETESSASELQGASRERAKRSLGFFLQTVLGLRVEDEVVTALQAIPLRQLLVVALSTALWCRLRGARNVMDPQQHEAVKWLFPEAKELRP